MQTTSSSYNPGISDPKAESTHTKHTPFQSSVLREIQQRGFISNITSRTLDGFLHHNRSAIYLGIDPSAPSLHVGNLLAIMGLLHFQLAGHQAIALVGGATGSIGDPSGRSTERNALDPDTLEHNVECIVRQLHRMLDHVPHTLPDCASEGLDIQVINNITWTAPVSIINFLATVGKYMRVGPMMMRESVRHRLQSDQGISFTEFSYQLLQAYDFWYLFHHHHCRVQLGGSDQWGNITAGIELVHKMHPDQVPSLMHPSAEPPKAVPVGPGKEMVKANEAFGVTLNLLTTSTGAKFGKSAGNAVWLDPTMTSVYDFYQFFIRTTDADVERLLQLLTFLPVKTIEQIMTEHRVNPEQRTAQTSLAEQVTLLVHGPKGLRQAQMATRLLFGDSLAGVEGGALEDIYEAFRHDPRLIELPLATLRTLTLPELAVRIGMCKSRSEAVRLARSGGFYVNHTRTADIKGVTVDESVHLLEGKLGMLRAGQKLVNSTPSQPTSVPEADSNKGQPDPPTIPNGDKQSSFASVLREKWNILWEKTAGPRMQSLLGPKSSPESVSPLSGVGHGAVESTSNTTALERTNVESLLRKLKSEWGKHIDVEALRQNPKLWTRAVAKTLNLITGYHHIEKLKQQVFTKEAEFIASRTALDEARVQHEQTATQRARCQREINNLLQRKHLWTDADVTQFTELYRNEHNNEQSETKAKAHLTECERVVEQKYSELVDAIRIRYHEEQLWSDKIRAAATYGTWAVLALNLFVFVFVHVVIEPRKRRRILDHVEHVVTESNEQLRADYEAHPPAWWESLAEKHMTGVAALGTTLERHLASLTDSQATVVPDSQTTPVWEVANHSAIPPTPLEPQETLHQIFSPPESKGNESHKTYTRNDVIVYTCESAALSCLVTALVALWLGR
ncbi:tyrosyl-tRNA synthetase [Dispira parvispora]|uniref:Tyrosine--tRNA ligase n=1 Tax=Dispira parvispora TaxID=1520584 RepID=A0A9W8E8S1_9FUNG|nr:tyrosyl-tRNA synthetase [Dispira parvispora]